MPSKAFWHEHFEDAYRDAAKKRREVIDRGLLLIAHLIREELPTATAITVDGSTLTGVRNVEGTVWQFNDEATSGRLSQPTRAHIRDTLLDMLTFYRFEKLLVAADWKTVPDIPGAFLVTLPADPDRDQERDAAPAAGGQPHGSPGEPAGNCAQCGRLLVWDQSGRRLNDTLGEYLCDGIRPAGARSRVHLLTEPAAAGAQPAAKN